MEVSSLWITVATVFLLGLLMKLLDQTFFRTSSKQQWPPGPTKLPLIGNLHQLNRGGELLHVVLSKMAQKYGGIMTVWFSGQQPSIVVSDHDVAWEVMVTKASDYSSRVLPSITRFTTADWRTLATSNLGPYWQTLRKGLHSNVINPQTISSQTQLQEKDIADLISSFEQEASSNDGVVEPMPKLRKLILRLIARFCFGPEFLTDEHFVERMDCAVEDEINLSGHTSLVDMFEFIRYIPGFGRPFKEAENLKQRIMELISPYLSTHKPSSPNCYLSFLLSQGLSEEVVICNLFELFVLAIDSTSTAITWALAFMIHNGEIQERVLKEVMKKGLGGRRRVVGVEEVSEMEYVHALVKETLRMRPVAPLGPHGAARDSELKGMKVREGTPVWVNLYAMLHDERVWKEPNRFMPERFLVGSGASGDRDDVWAMERSFVAFGAGRRNCGGMELAKIQVAVTVANLVNSFEWCSAVEGQLPDLSEDLTFVLMMKTPLVARVVPRWS